MELERLESFTWTDSGQLAEVYPVPRLLFKVGVS